MAQAAPQTVTPSAGTDPNLGYRYDIPTADECRANAQSVSSYGWRKNHYAYCQVTLYQWKYTNGLGFVLATGQDRVTVVGQGSFGGDPTRNNGDGRVITLTLYVDQVQVTSGTLPAGATLTFSFTCTGDPAGSCQTTDQPVTKPDNSWNNSSATFTFTSPDGVGTTVGTHWVAFADGMFHWVVTPNCTACTTNGSTSGPDGHVRFDGPGSADMSPAHQTGATFQPVDSGDSQIVDTLDYAYNGVYGTGSYALAAHHYYVALNFPNSTYPLTGNKTIPTVLSRLADSNLSDAGRRTVAIPLCRQVWGDAYATHYGLGTDGNPLQCDEFPFASTRQGSPLRNGLPDGTSISVCPINGPDNQTAGLAEKAFFQQQRIFDGDVPWGGTAVDWFKVAVTSVPTPAPTAAQALPCPVPDPNAPGVGRLVANIPNGGQFLDVWDANNDQLGALGDPTGNEATVTGGEEQLFAGGGIYWSSATGSHEVSAGIGSKYSALGGTSSVLGFPTSDEQNAAGGGRENTFAGTSCNGSGSVILWSSATGAHEMQGCIYNAYLATYGGPGGIAGYPVSDEMNDPTGTGRVSYMSGSPCNSSTGSAIYWNGAAHLVRGCAYQTYKANGETLHLGFPTADEYTDSSGWHQYFQHGHIDNGVVTYFSTGCTDYGGTTMTGPNACEGFYTTTSTWFSGGGVGLFGQEIWTYANGTVKDSTANYTLHGLDTTRAYTLQAYIPNNHSDASHAHYYYCGTNQGCADGYVNQNNFNNAWANFGTVCTTDGNVTITLADNGGDVYPAQVGADAIRAVRTGIAC